jgi:predicted DNA binding CopG/RHH family protein
MRAECDFSKLLARKNPYVSRLTRRVTLHLSDDVVAYFKDLSDEAGLPYQGLIHLYLRDCLANQRKLQIKWPQAD